jgi:sugar-specific transcriptional regulator TrmB
MYESFLEGTGLTKNESLVYLTLLQSGKSKSSHIIKESKISSGKIYETLDKLIAKGLVKVVLENGIKHFIANNPKVLFDYLSEKEKLLHDKKSELEKLLPGLENLRKIDSELEMVSLIKGFRGVTPIVYDALEQGKIIKIMGVRSSKNVKFNNFWKNWHRQRVLLKKKALMLFSDKNTEYWDFYTKMPYTELKAISSISPSAVMIIDNNCFLFSYDEELTCIHIVSDSIAKSFEGFFDGLWNVSSK